MTGMKRYLKKAALVSATLMVSATADAGTLLQRSNLVYKGAFRVPQGRYGNSTRDSSLSFGGSAITFRAPDGSNGTDGSLYILGYDKLVTEISIPKIVDSRDSSVCPTHDISCLNTASVVQGSFDVTNGQMTNIGANFSVVPEGSPAGFLVHNNKLIGSLQTQYDDTNVYSHFTASLDWNTGVPSSANFTGPYRLGVNPVDSTSTNAGFVGGYMAHIPSEYQAELGGPALTGMIVDSVISRSSYGPDAWVFDPDQMAVGDPASAQMLLGYPSDHSTLMNYASFADQPTANGSIQVRGLTFPEGSRSLIFWGWMGMGMSGKGSMCYGEATGTLSEVADASTVSAWIAANNGQPYMCGGNPISATDHNPCCYDPVRSGSKGEHAYPYIYRAWVYDAEDLAAVKAGTKNPWDLAPYAVWDLNSYTINPGVSYTMNSGTDDLPFAIEDAAIVGAAYDPATQRIYISQKAGDKPNLEPFPLIHVFAVQVGAGTGGSTSGGGSTGSTADVQAPTVPASLSATALSASQIALSWSPSTDNVGVAGYNVYRNGNQIATTTATSFQDSALSAATTYSYSVAAFDAANNVSAQSSVASATTQQAADTIAPTVTIGSPAAGSTVGGTVSVSANASDNVGVTKVEFYVNGALQATDSSAPYSFSWNTAGFANGSYTLTMKAYDAAGNVGQASSTVNVQNVQKDTTPPTVSIASPASGSTVSGTVNVSANATDNVGVTKVEFYVNGALQSTDTSSPYNFSWNTASLVNSSYTLTMKAYDAAGNVGQASSTVNVQNVQNDTTPPTVSITSPASGSTVTGKVVVSVNATDNVRVAKVELYLDGKLQATDTSAPYTFSWNTNPVAKGTHTLIAKAYDAAGNVANSSSIVVKH